MKIKSVKVGLTVNMGNYESTRIDLEAELGPNDSAYEVYELLKEGCKLLTSKKDGIAKWERIIENPDCYTGKQVGEAKRELAKVKKTMEKLGL